MGSLVFWPEGRKDIEALLPPVALSLGGRSGSHDRKKGVAYEGKVYRSFAQSMENSAQYLQQGNRRCKHHAGTHDPHLSTMEKFCHIDPLSSHQCDLDV